MGGERAAASFPSGVPVGSAPSGGGRAAAGVPLGLSVGGVPSNRGQEATSVPSEVCLICWSLLRIG